MSNHKLSVNIQFTISSIALIEVLDFIVVLNMSNETFHRV